MNTQEGWSCAYVGELNRSLVVVVECSAPSSVE